MLEEHLIQIKSKSTMKFLQITACLLAALLSTVHSANLRSQEAFKQSLLQKAIPVDKDGNPRMLENNQEFEVTYDYSIQFSSCLSLKTGPNGQNNNGNNNNGDNQNQLLFSSDLIGYTQAGKITNEKSYVLFNLCKTEYCSYHNEDMKSIYLIGLNDYMQSLAQYYLDEQEKFCAACYYNYNYCEYYKEQTQKYNQYYKTNSKYGNASMAQSEFAGSGYSVDGTSSSSASDEVADEATSSSYQQEEQGSYNEESGGNRKLSVDMTGFKVLNCTKCDEMLCDANAEDGNNANANYNQNGEPQVDMESVAQWIDAMTGCPQTSGLLLNTYPLYSGFMCNEDGTGIEIALFLDEECLTYTSLQSFSKVASAQYDDPYLEHAKKILTYPIEHDISCNGGTQYINQEVYKQIQAGTYTSANGDDNNGNGNNNNENRNEASEFCRDLFDGGENGEAVSIGNCNQNGNNYYSAVAYDENGNEIPIMYNDYYYTWYTYVVSAENADDVNSVCPIVNALHGEYTYLYQAGGSGSLYKATSNVASGGSSFSKVTQYAQMASEKLTPKIIIIISAVTILATLALCCVLYSCCCGASTANQYTEQTEKVGRQRRRRSISQDDSRRERLVDATTGKLA